MIFNRFWKLFSDDVCVWFLCLAGGAGASAHLEKTANGMEGVAFFACRPFARGSEKVKICMKSTIKKHLENRTTKRLRKTSKNIRFLTKIESKCLPKSIPEGSGGLLRAVGRLEPPKMAQKSPPERLRSDFSSKNKPGYHGTGSARGDRATSTASDARAAREARGMRARAPAPRGAATQERQEQSEHEHSKRT